MFLFLFSLQVLTTEYDPEEWSKETEDLMTEPIPEQPGTNVDTKDTSVDKAAPTPTKAPAPSEAKVSSTTTEKAATKTPSRDQKITPQSSNDVVRGAPPAPAQSKELKRGTEGTEVRQRKSQGR